MTYTKVSLTVKPLEPGREILVAVLAEIGYESFVDTDFGVDSYIRSEQFDNESLSEAISIDALSVSSETEELPDENWNQKWEDSFEPVIVTDRCVIRAPFHSPKTDYEYELVIRPQMSFGTGHHQTTCLMVEFLLDLDLKGQKLLDVGTGTGVLAILAEKLGAVDIMANDIEDYILDNAKENILHNSCVHIGVEKADLQAIGTEDYHVTLANINLNALLHEMENLVRSIKRGGVLILSGFYEQDSDLLVKKAKEWGAHFAEMKTRDHWTALKLIKD